MTFLVRGPIPPVTRESILFGYSMASAADAAPALHVPSGGVVPKVAAIGRLFGNKASTLADAPKTQFTYDGNYSQGGLLNVESRLVEVYAASRVLDVANSGELGLLPCGFVQRLTPQFARAPTTAQKTGV